jgi:hypothetical protein
VHDIAEDTVKQTLSQGLQKLMVKPQVSTQITDAIDIVDMEDSISASNAGIQEEQEKKQRQKTTEVPSPCDHPLSCLMMEAVLIKEQFVGITMDPNREKVDKRDKDGIKRQEFDQEFFTMGMYVSKLLPYANRNFKMGAPAIVKLLKS